ncbi:MAG: hypothetical protein ACFFDQ_07900 [Candidatus Thorarchaeota archaeon]
MSETKTEKIDEFWLFHDIEEREIIELRKFIDPEIDLKPLKDIVKLFDKIHAFFK